MDADRFFERLAARRSDEELAKVQRHYQGPTRGDQCLGVLMGAIFALAKQFADLSLDQIEKLLESQSYEVGMGGVSVMDFQDRREKTPDGRRKELFDLDLRRHDRINNWDLVDRAAPRVVGGYLCDKSRDILYKPASSRNVWQRRTAIVSTSYFIRLGDLDETFAVAKLLIGDENEYVQKAVGSWPREAGKKDQKRLLSFVEKHLKSMPGVTLRYATEKLDKSTRNKDISGTKKAVRKKK